MSNSITKICSSCNKELPATFEYFYKDAHGLLGFKSRCKSCLRAYDANRYQTPEIRDRYHEKHREWVENNRRHVADIQRRYYRNNRKEIQKREKIYGPARRKRYNKKHPEKSNEVRARRAAAEGTLTAEDIAKQYEIQNGRCWWCGKKLGKHSEIDHRIPLSKGGTNWPNNIVIAHRKCNRSKGDKMPWEWNGRLL